MKLSKQDKNGVRTAVDLQRRYRPEQIKKNQEEIEELKKEKEIDSSLSLSSVNAVQNKVITKALNNKIEKIEGKGLSDNNFTNEDKNSIHTHSNKAILDSITEGEVAAWNELLGFQVYQIGDIYTTTNEDDPNSTFHYGTWEKVNTQALETITIYMWLRKS